MLLELDNPRTLGSAETLGYFRRTPLPISPDELAELEELEGRTYFWFPPEYVVDTATTQAEQAAQHAHGHLRALPEGQAYLWALAASQAQFLRQEADAYAAAGRGLFRHRLGEMGFAPGEEVEEALRAFLGGRRVEVQRPINAPAALLVDGKVVARTFG